MPGPGIFLKSGMPLISGVSGDVFRHCVRAFLLFSSTFCVHFYYFPALFSVRISTVFSTVGVHFYYVAALFACISAVFVCVCMCLFVCVCMCCIVCVCMCLYVLVGRVAPQTRMLFCRTLYQNVPVLILLKINDMGPYGIHLITPHCISITLLLHYYTSESQHFLRVLTLFFASSQPASQSS